MTGNAEERLGARVATKAVGRTRAARLHGQQLLGDTYPEDTLLDETRVYLLGVPWVEVFESRADRRATAFRMAGLAKTRNALGMPATPPRHYCPGTGTRNQPVSHPIEGSTSGISSPVSRWMAQAQA